MSYSIFLNFSLHFWIENPPLSRPIWLIVFSASSNYLNCRLGINTPAIFSSDLSSLIVARLAAYTTLPLDYYRYTENLQQRTWLRPSKRKHLGIIYPYLFCFQQVPSWFLWIFSSRRLPFASEGRNLYEQLQFFVCKAVDSCIYMIFTYDWPWHSDSFVLDIYIFDKNHFG